MGDRHSHLCVLDKQSEAVWNDLVATTKKSLTKLLEQAPARRVVMEVATHSPQVSRLASANARNLDELANNIREAVSLHPVGENLREL